MKIDGYITKNGEITEVIVSDKTRGITAKRFKTTYKTKWLEMGVNKDNTHSIKCPFCGIGRKIKGHANSWKNFQTNKFCGYCGTYMWEEEGEKI